MCRPSKSLDGVTDRMPPHADVSLARASDLRPVGRVCRPAWVVTLGIACLLMSMRTATGLSATRALPAGVENLTMVWTDTRAGQGVEIWAMRLDDMQPRQVITLANGTRPLALNGRHLALSTATSLVLIDLISGEQRTLEAGQPVRSALYADGFLYYVTRAGCGPQTEEGHRLFRINMETGQSELVVRVDGPGTELLGYAAAGPALIAMPRGCDIGVNAIWTVDPSTGAVIRETPVFGCGWARVTDDGTRAVVGHIFCPPLPTEPSADATVYDINTGDVRRFTVSEGAITNTPMVLSPHGRQAAFAVTVTSGTGPGATRSGGVWLLDLDGLTATRLWQDDSAEAMPMAWSPDGSALIAGSVLAQGFCEYSVVDTRTGEAVSLGESVTVCGVNGEVVGWTVVP
jgi:hypothetical protein